MNSSGVSGVSIDLPPPAARALLPSLVRVESSGQGRGGAGGQPPTPFETGPPSGPTAAVGAGGPIPRFRPPPPPGGAPPRAASRHTLRPADASGAARKIPIW